MVQRKEQTLRANLSFYLNLYKYAFTNLYKIYKSINHLDCSSISKIQIQIQIQPRWFIGVKTRRGLCVVWSNFCAVMYVCQRVRVSEREKERKRGKKRERERATLGDGGVLLNRPPPFDGVSIGQASISLDTAWQSVVYRLACSTHTYTHTHTHTQAIGAPN